MSKLNNDADALSYALSKQVDAALAVETSYGAIELDEQMKRAVANALRPILKARLNAVLAQIAHTNPVIR